MKKNKMMRTASGLLVLTLLTTSIISGTFAKYVTSDSGTDSARVAKFGVAITAEGETFAKEYDTHDADVKATIAKSVVSTDKVIAPGTDGEMVSMTLTGTPEVAVAVSYDGKVDISDNWYGNTAGQFYCPLVIKVNTTEINGKDYTSAAAMEAAINEAITGYSKNYPANTDLSSISDDSLAISWAWPFSTSEANDLNDTALGNQAAAGNAATITIEVTTTVTQID